MWHTSRDKGLGLERDLVMSMWGCIMPIYTEN